MSKNDEESCVKEKGIENNGVTILKDLSEEDIAKLQYVENNGVLLIPRNILSKLAAKGFENNGIVVPYQEGMRIYSGTTNLNTSALEAFDTPLELVQVGKLTFTDDITPELAKSKIKDIKNFGVIVAPEKIYGVIMSKVSENFGKIVKPGEDIHKHNSKHQNCNCEPEEDE
jgi:hypothetical protein